MPTQASAHGEPAFTTDNALLSLLLSVDGTSAALLLLMGALYVAGLGHLGSRGPQQRRRLLYGAGWGMLALALLPPVDSMGGELFSAHMFQHELMMLLAAPLLIWSQPAAVLLWGAPQRVRRALARAGKRRLWISTRRFLLRPAVAWSVHAAALWGWHIPLLFELSLSNQWVHTLQHISFFGSALLFWAACAGRMRELATAVLLLTTALHASMLGALLTFSTEVWYSSYLVSAPLWGITALEDQQLGGLIMWVPGGLVFVAMSLHSLMHVFVGGERDEADDTGSAADTLSGSARARPSPPRIGAAGTRIGIR